jgi:hypothetical protein
MSKTRALVFFFVLISLVAVAVYADVGRRIQQFLIGYEEVPSISTTGNGEFNAVISPDEKQINWVLSYSDLQGAVQQSHIHIGQKGVNGGISVFLCTNLGNGPAGTQPCPTPPATISGIIRAADVSPNIPATAAARSQGLDTGEFGELLAAMRAGATYVNVHSSTWPGGEIRSQIAVTEEQTDVDPGNIEINGIRDTEPIDQMKDHHH